ncbi:hypothetical protein ACQP1W_43590 [Spirillospora sp. CA-255316]
MVGLVALGVGSGCTWTATLVGIVGRADSDRMAVGGSLQDTGIHVGAALAGPINVTLQVPHQATFAPSWVR